MLPAGETLNGERLTDFDGTGERDGCLVGDLLREGGR